ncbi:MAG: type III pantothenate kinase [Alphaproteobacteria bacterium]|nr:type III pantothenate kinase [Alphaproteobacteria bacterium]
MLLAIDAGNTNTVFAVFEGETLRAQWRASTNAARTADEYTVWLSQLMGLEGLGRADVTEAIISTVVPQALFSLRQLCVKFFGTEPGVIGDPKLDLGIRINLERPDVVGADRLVNAVAAHAAYEGALIVIDFGTATTFDVVSPSGDYEGGVIAPGINLSLEALHQAAAKLPRIAVERPKKVIGTDTVPAMQSGVYWGYVGLIEGLVARIKAEYGAPMTVISTGGLAALFRHSTDVIEHVDPDLTMRGLLTIHRRAARTVQS